MANILHGNTIQKRLLKAPTLTSAGRFVVESVNKAVIATSKAKTIVPCFDFLFYCKFLITAKQVHEKDISESVQPFVENISELIKRHCGSSDLAVVMANKQDVFSSEFLICFKELQQTFK